MRANYSPFTINSIKQRGSFQTYHNQKGRFEEVANGIKTIPQLCEEVFKLFQLTQQLYNNYHTNKDAPWREKEDNKDFNTFCKLYTDTVSGDGPNLNDSRLNDEEEWIAVERIMDEVLYFIKCSY